MSYEQTEYTKITFTVTSEHVGYYFCFTLFSCCFRVVD